MHYQRWQARTSSLTPEDLPQGTREISGIMYLHLSAMLNDRNSEDRHYLGHIITQDSFRGEAYSIGEGHIVHSFGPPPAIVLGHPTPEGLKDLCTYMMQEAYKYRKPLNSWPDRKKAKEELAKQQALQQSKQTELNLTTVA